MKACRGVGASLPLEQVKAWEKEHRALLEQIAPEEIRDTALWRSCRAAGTELKIRMPFSVQVHHSFADGLHIGQFAEKLQEFLGNLK